MPLPLPHFSASLKCRGTTSPPEPASRAVSQFIYEGQFRKTGTSMTRLHLLSYNSFTDPIERPSLVGRRCRVSHFTLPSYEIELWQWKWWHCSLATKMLTSGHTWEKITLRQLWGFYLETGLRCSTETLHSAWAACCSVGWCRLERDKGDASHTSPHPPPQVLCVQLCHLQNSTTPGYSTQHMFGGLMIVLGPRHILIRVTLQSDYDIQDTDTNSITRKHCSNGNDIPAALL